VRLKDFDTLFGKSAWWRYGGAAIFFGGIVVRDATNGELSLGALSGVSLEFREILNKMLARANADWNTKDAQRSALLKHLLYHTSVLTLTPLNFHRNMPALLSAYLLGRQARQ